MTLREEIFKQEKNFDLDETSDEVLYEHTESIIKLFEKMIDEKIDSYENISLNDTIIKTDCLRELKKELSK